MKQYEEKFLAAYDKYASSILRHIFFRVNNKEVAEDIVQETFLKTWEYIVSENKEIKNLKSFLYKVANNLTIDYYRRKTKMPIPLEDAPEKELAYEPEQERRAELAISRSLIEKYLSEMNDSCREVLLYRYMDGLSIREISAITGKSFNNISVIIHRALKVLKEKMKNVQKI